MKDRVVQSHRQQIVSTVEADFISQYGQAPTMRMLESSSPVPKSIFNTHLFAGS